MGGRRPDELDGRPGSAVSETEAKAHPQLLIEPEKTLDALASNDAVVPLSPGTEHAA